MKKLLYLIIMMAAIYACGKKTKDQMGKAAVDVTSFYLGDEQLKPTDVTFHCVVKEPNGEKFLLSVNGKDQAYDVPADGKVIIQLKQIIPQYSGITYGVKYFPIYLGGNEPIQMEFSANPDDWKVSFAGGNKEINEYLFGKVRSVGSEFFMHDESRLIKETEKALEQNLNILKNCQLPEDFTKIEAKRLIYFVYGEWNSYAFNHRWMVGLETFEPNDIYYDKLKTLLREDESILSVPVYRRFLEKNIPIFTSRGLKNASPKDLALKNAEFVIANYDNLLLRRYLLDYFISEYISEYGTNGAEELITIYKQNIADSSRLEVFDEIIEDWDKLDQGDISPDFVYTNVQGDSVHLTSFRGKYVYIDIWASWCGPCRREIPALKALEEKFAGKPIVFISISCDKDPEAWKKAMQEEKVGGIQLIVGKDLSFLKSYRVQGIPRFILLDQEGKIINAKMTLPSDPQTEETLKSLPGLN